MDHFSFTQICRQCKTVMETFKIELTNYNEEGNCLISNQEIFENFSFTCEHCDLLNLLDFEELCNSATIRYIRRQEQFKRQIDEIISNLLQIQIEKLNLIKK